MNTPRRADAEEAGGGCVLMVGTALHTRGGVASLVNAWRDAGLFSRWQVRYVGSNGGRSATGAVLAALCCYAESGWLMLTGRVRLVHVHHSSFISFWRKAPVFLLAMLFRRPLVVSLHGGAFMTFYDALPAPVRWWQRRVMRYATRYLVLTERWATWARGVEPAANVTVLPNLVAAVPPHRPAYQDGDGEPTLLFLGRIEALKGVPELVEALAAAHALGAPWRLVLGGTGDTEQTLRAATALGLPEGVVHCAGWVDPTAKDRLLRQCSALVLPSHIENMPMVILEAFAYGRPVVSTCVGGIPDMVQEGRQGLLVTPRDAAALAQALVRLWQLGPEQRASMGALARQDVEQRYSAAVVMATLDAIYAQATAKKA